MVVCIDAHQIPSLGEVVVKLWCVAALPFSSLAVERDRLCAFEGRKHEHDCFRIPGNPLHDLIHPNAEKKGNGNKSVFRTA